jgi:hypothetical protein
MLSIFKYQRDRRFWTLRYYLNAAKFQINKLFFKGGEKWRELRDSSSFYAELFRLSFSSLLTAIILVLLVTTIEKNLLSYLSVSNINIEWVRYFTQSILAVQANIIKNGHIFETLLSVIASISGVFIGLYFTAISVVVSSVYAKVTSDIRGLLLDEKGGNVYIRSLSVVTAISLILLGYMITGGHPGILSALFMVVIGCYGVLCFVMLGIRAFFFFDPTKLCDVVFYEFHKYLKLATVSGFGWEDPSFQAHYQKMAAKSISTLRNIIKLCCDEQYLKKQPLSIVLQKAIFSLCEYEKLRYFIPSDSRWYSLMPRHKKWFLSDSSALEIALQTQTSIQPDMIPNTYWVEDEIMGMIFDALKMFVQQNNVELAYEVLGALNVYLGKVGNDLGAKRGRKYLNDLGALIDSCPAISCSAGVQTKQKAYELALIDSYGLAGLSLALGVYEMAREFNVQSIVAKIESIDLLEDKSIYNVNILPPILSRVEFVRKGLKFEKNVEGKLISPKWYINQLILVRYAELVKESLEELIVTVEECFVSRADALFSSKQYIMTTNHAQRGLEMCHKMKAHVPQIQQMMADLKSKTVNKDITFPVIDWDLVNTRIDGARNKLVENIAKCIPGLSLIEYEDNIPDYFGQAYNIVCQECYAALLNNNPVLFNRLFPPLFYGSLSAHDKLRSETKDMQQEVMLAISFDPLKDIMEISGYALICSELYEAPDVWAKCKGIWDKYLGSSTKTAELLGVLITIFQYRRGAFSSSPRDYLRMNWQIWFNNKLRELKLLSDSFSVEYYLDRSEKVKHKSPLIRAICRNGFDFHVSAAEVFIMMYLLKCPESNGIEYDDVWGLSEAIEQESEDLA